jgi:hypothetical protein
MGPSCGGVASSSVAWVVECIDLLEDRGLDGGRGCFSVGGGQFLNRRLDGYELMLPPTDTLRAFDTERKGGVERPSAEETRAKLVRLYNMTSEEIEAYERAEARYRAYEANERAEGSQYGPPKLDIDELYAADIARGVHDPENAPSTVCEDEVVGWVSADLDWGYDEPEDPEQDEGRWSPPAAGEPVRLYSRKEAAHYVHIPERWIEKSIVLPFPDPDGTVGAAAGWLQLTLDWWGRTDPPRRGPRREPLHFMSRPEVAAYMGLEHRGLSGVAMPPPDAVMGSRRVGWLPATIDTWNTQRPGKRRHPRAP